MAVREIELIILGSSSALPTRDRITSSQLLRVGNLRILLDCGESTQLSLLNYGVSILKIDHIFISHLHGDHYFGLAPLISSMHLFGRRKPLNIYADDRLEAITREQFEIADTKLSFPMIFHSLHQDGVTSLLEHGSVSVKSFPLEHRIPTCGFLIELDAEKQKESTHSVKFAYCSDTKYSSSYLNFIRGVDLLYHEATFAEDKRDFAREKFHSTARDAAYAARKAMVGSLLIGHFSARYHDPNILGEEAREVFNEVHVAMDGLRVRIRSKDVQFSDR